MVDNVFETPGMINKFLQKCYNSNIEHAMFIEIQRMIIDDM